MKRNILLWIIGVIFISAGLASASYLGDFLKAGINPTQDPIYYNYTGISFEGATGDGNETTISITDPTADRTITIPDSSGTIYLDTDETIIQYDTTDINATAIKDLATSPYELVAAPGEGKVIEFISAVMILDYGGVAYDSNGDLSIETGTTGTTLSGEAAEDDFLFNDADSVQVIQALSADSQLDANESLVLDCATGDPASGNGTLTVNTVYRVHTTGL